MRIIDGVTWCFVVLGWFATHVFSEMRERRKECRSMLDKIEKLLEETEIKANEFHLAANYKSENARALQTNIQKIESWSTKLHLINADSFVPYQIALRRSITLNNFDASKFRTVDANDRIIEEIRGAFSDLEEFLESEYRAKYPNRFPYFNFR